MRTWALWGLGPRTVTWMLGCDVLTIGLVLLIQHGEPHVSASAWALGAILAASALLHGVLTRPSEERRRGAQIAHGGDLSCVWFITSALLVPLAVSIALIAMVRAQRYLIARKPPGRYLFTTGAILTSTATAHLAAFHVLTPEHSDLNAAWHLAIGMGAYFGAQTLIIGVACGLLSGWTKGWTEFGDTRENTTFLVHLCASVTFAIALHAAWLVAAVALPALVAATRLNQHLAQLHADREQLENDALHDPLTGLPNRRGFDPRAALALTTDHAQQATTAVLMLDLDHFKNWNTHLGHFGADEVLKTVARILRAETRHADLLCRWGGEELVVVIPTTTRDHATALAERIRAAIETAPITVSLPTGDRTVTLGRDGWPPCTVSIGAAFAPDHGTDLPTVQQAADTALQTAKDHGRNQIHLTPTSAATPTSPPREPTAP